MDLPDTLPVMVLPRCNLFPGSRLPLYIFEPRYREMLDDALHGGRMFCIGTVGGDAGPEPGGPGVYPHSTAGVIRACVGNDDGTSRLILEGLLRVRFTGWRDGGPYRVAEIEAVPTAVDDKTEVARLCEQLKALAAERLAAEDIVVPGGDIGDLWRNLGSEEAIADFVAHHLISEVDKRQRLLGMESLEGRLVFLCECLLE